MKLLIICSVYRSNEEKPNYDYYNTTQGSAPRHIPGRTYYHVFFSIGTVRYNRKIRVRERLWGGIACQEVTRLVGFYDVTVMVPLKRVRDVMKLCSLRLVVFSLLRGYMYVNYKTDNLFSVN